MALIYAFNGDADGLCALQQLRLADQRDAALVTGVKRDTKLLRRVQAGSGDEITVLDVSLAQNRDDVARLLDAGAAIRYFDHHHAGTLPQHERFDAHIEEGTEVCTSTLVDRHLGGRHRAWAIVAAFGDNLPQLGAAVAKAAGIDASAVATLERLGIALNYNAYGESLADLCFDPAALAQQMLPFADPAAFVRDCSAYRELTARYDDDMRTARALRPLHCVPGATIVELPDEAWARRVIGVLANELTQSSPADAIAILAPRRGGGYTASVRVPAGREMTADEFCRGFAGGGGRTLAAGINRLPPEDLDRFIERFEASFRTR